jgi:hypothetical protein
MTRLPHPILAATLAVLLAAACAVQAQSGTYAIEMLVFAHPGGAHQAEAWRADPGEPDTSRATPVARGGEVSALGPSSYRLSGAWQALRNSASYRPLRHLAWTQPGYSEARAPHVLIGDGPGAELRGVVQVSRSRFLHAKIDLVYRDGGQSYRFTTRRRMRSNELHHLDHPLFSVLVIVTPLGG